MERKRQAGGGLVLVFIAIALALASAGALALTSANVATQRSRASERALAQARDALISHAADRPIDARVGPGYLPCPDLDDDGWAETTCGSLGGHLGQAERLGRLPWKTLGLPDLRDGYGERLWYAVSTRYKGLLNCAASRACIDMTPATALGTITVRDGRGALVHDGTLGDPGRADSGGAVAVVIAPGPASRRADGEAQRRECAPGECDERGRCILEPATRAAHCDPRNYLERAGGEDNYAFKDRSDARAGNVDGFILGPVEGSNDRVLAIGFADVVPRVMARVGIEVAHCLRQAIGAGEPAAADAACGAGTAVGRVPDSLLAGVASCNATTDEEGWWAAWRAHVVYARAGPSGIAVVDARGAQVSPPRRFALLVTRRANECAVPGLRCDAAHCDRLVEPDRAQASHVLVGNP